MLVLRAVCLSLILSLLGACGQKGPLYLPAPEQTPSTFAESN